MLETFTWCGHASLGGASGRSRQAGVDRPDGVELHAVVAAGPGGSRVSDREWANGVLGTRRRNALAAAHGADAAADGPHAGGGGAVGLRRCEEQEAAPAPGMRPATARSTNTAPKPCAGSKRSSASSWNFSTACATPRTRPNSTNSWPSGAAVPTAPHRVRRSSERIGGASAVGNGVRDRSPAPLSLSARLLRGAAWAKSRLP